MNPVRVKFSETKVSTIVKLAWLHAQIAFSRSIHSSTTANDADKLLAAFYLCCLRITTLVVLILAYCPCRCSHWHRQWLFAYRCKLLYARNTFRQGGPYFAGKNWTGGPLFTPDQLSCDTTPARQIFMRFFASLLSGWRMKVENYYLRKSLTKHYASFKTYSVKIK